MGGRKNKLIVSGAKLAQVTSQWKQGPTTKTAPPIKKMFCWASGWVRSTLLDLFPQLAPGSDQACQHQTCLPTVFQVFHIRDPEQEKPCLHPSRTPAAATFTSSRHPCSSFIQAGGSRCPGPWGNQPSSLEWVLLSAAEPSVAIPLQAGGLLWCAPQGAWCTQS